MPAPALTPSAIAFPPAQAPARAIPSAPGTAAALPLVRHDEGLGAAERRLLVAGIAGLHVLALWGLLQVDAVRQAVHEMSPLIVDFIAPEAPPPPRRHPHRLRAHPGRYRARHRPR